MVIPWNLLYTQVKLGVFDRMFTEIIWRMKMKIYECYNFLKLIDETNIISLLKMADLSSKTFRMNFRSDELSEKALWIININFRMTMLKTVTSLLAKSTHLSKTLEKKMNVWIENFEQLRYLVLFFVHPGIKEK